MTQAEVATRPGLDGLLRRTLRRRWVPILTQGTILSVALMATAYVVPVYKAVVLFQVASLDDYRVDPGGISPHQEAISMITCSKVLSDAATDPKLAVLPRIQRAKDPVAELRDAVRVTEIPGTLLVEVSAVSRSPQEAATLVNAVADAYFMDRVDSAVMAERHTFEPLKRYLADLKSRDQGIALRRDQPASRRDLRERKDGDSLINVGLSPKMQLDAFENDMRRIEIQADLAAFRPRMSDYPRQIIVDLEARLESTNRLAATLKASPASEDDEREDVASNHAQQELVLRRLKYLTGSHCGGYGEPWIRPLGVASTPTRPLNNYGYRLAIMALIPFATFSLVIGLFAGIEHRSTGRAARSEAA